MYAEDVNDFLKITIGGKAAPAALIAQLTDWWSCEHFDWEWACLEPWETTTLP